jgi:carbonic anhydrase
VCGHYNCGGVKAANANMRLGLVDNWIMNVVDIKNRYASLLDKIPAEHKDDALCELNVICQVRNVMESTVMQDWWKGYRQGERQSVDWDQRHIEEALSEHSETEATTATAVTTPAPATSPDHHAVDIHGWIYGLKDGLVVPLITITAGDNPELKLKKALADIVRRYAPHALKKNN